MYFDNVPGGDHPPERTIGHIHALYRRIFTLISSRHTPDETSRPLIMTLQGLFGADGAVICTIRDGGAVFAAALGSLSQMQNATLDVESSRTLEFLQSGEARIKTREEMGRDYVTLTQNAHFEVTLLVPLALDSHPYGLIALVSDRPDYFRPEDADLLQNIAVYISMLYRDEAIRAYEHDKRYFEQIGGAVRRITPELSDATRDLVDTFSQVRKHIARQSSSLLDEYISDAAGYIEKMARKIQDLHALYEICDAPDLSFETLDLKPIIDSVVKYNAAQIESCAKLSLIFESDVPSVSGEYMLIWQIVHELIQNAISAIKIGPHGDDEITVHCFALPSAAVIEVSDTGCGVSPADRGKLYTPFFTSWSAARGLGLTRAKVNAILLHGSIAYRPRELCGSIFSIVLPDVQFAPQEHVF